MLDLQARCPDQGMLASQFCAQDGEAKIMPINYKFCTSNAARNMSNHERRDTGRVLKFSSSHIGQIDIPVREYIAEGEQSRAECKAGRLSTPRL